MKVHPPIKQRPLCILAGIIAGILVSNIAVSQHHYVNSYSSVQKGLGLKFQLDVPTSGSGSAFKFEGYNWRIGITGGLGSFMGDDRWFYPCVNADIMVYEGGIGSKWPGHVRPKSLYMQWDLEVILSYTFTCGIQDRLKYENKINPTVANIPLYYFNTFTFPSLQNPFEYSISLGGNMIWFPTRKKRDTRYQQVGFLNLHLGRFQFVYVNDGPPFEPPFGDKYDRLHTGNGFITFHGDRKWFVNLIEVGYDKFTGYSRNAYELSNRIGNGYLYHRDTLQQFYNKSRFYVNISKVEGPNLGSNGYGVAFSFYNFADLDVQHKIHLSSSYPLHMVPYKQKFTIAPLYYWQNTSIGMK